MQSTIQRLNVKMWFNHDAMRDEKNNNFINKAKVALRSNNCFSINFKVHLCFICGARYLLFTFLQVQERGTLNNIDHILFSVYHQVSIYSTRQYIILTRSEVTSSNALLTSA